MDRLVGWLRYLVLMAVFGLAGTAVAAFAWSVAKSVKLVSDLVGGDWKNDSKVIDLLKVVDSYLLAVVLVIVVIGLYQLFINDVDAPEWLQAKSLEDLKRSIVDVLIVFLGVKGVEGLLATKAPLDSLYFSGAVAVLIGSLTLFRSSGKGKKPITAPPSEKDTSDES
jgi:uncharacterized membrane protein YqhA